MTEIPLSDIDEDELREKLKDTLVEKYQQNTLKLLAYTFSADPNGIEVDSDYSVPRGEAVLAKTTEDAIESLKYVLKTQGRTGALYAVVGTLKQLYPEEEYHKLLLFVELSATKDLLEQKEPFSALIRGATFLEKALGERVSSESNLGYLIQEAVDDNVLSDKQEMLAQFVRECRNDVGHNFWLETEYNYVIHEHAVRTQFTLLDSLLASWYQTRWNPAIPSLTAEQCLKVIHDHYKFEWGSKDGLRQWKSGSIAEKYDRR